jgi:hypothetical protein
MPRHDFTRTSLIRALLPKGDYSWEDASVIACWMAAWGASDSSDRTTAAAQLRLRKRNTLMTTGALVTIELSIDERNELFEVDFWKADFSPLRRYPRPEDLKSSNARR